MRPINSSKHAELIYVIREMEVLFAEEGRDKDRDALIHNKVRMVELHQEYLQTMNYLEKIKEEYHAESRSIRLRFVSQPFRKLRLKKIKPDKYKMIVNLVNRLTG